MHIAFINNTQNWGGVKTWCLSMARSCIKEGHRASIIGKDPVFIAKAKEKGIVAERYSPGVDFNPAAILHYYRFFTQNKVTAVVVNISKDLRTAGVAARLLGIPLIQHIGAPRDFTNTCKKRLENALLQPALVCCSQFVLDSLRLSVPHTKKLIATALVPGTHCPVVSSFSVLPHLRIVATSRLSTEKKHIDLLQAVKSLTLKGYIFSLTIVGDGKERATLEAYTAKNNLEKRVRFTGFTTNVEAYLQNADVFVLPTLCEPLGIALEEAMAFGLIPVARKAGGVPEIWPTDMKSLLIEPKSGADGFANALESLLQKSPEELTLLRQKVAEHAKQSFSEETQYAKLAKWIETL